MVWKVCIINLKRIKDHANLQPVRIKAVLRTLSDRLKTDGDFKNKKKLEHFLDEQLSR